jgi:hypothetical protein
MKNLKKVKLLVIIFILLSVPLSIFAQPHPNGGSAPSTSIGNTTVGGGAPIGSGIIILLVMGAAYGGHKLYHMRNMVLPN